MNYSDILNVYIVYCIYIYVFRFGHEFLGFDDLTSTAEAYSGISSIGCLRCRLSDYHGAVWCQLSWFMLNILFTSDVWFCVSSATRGVATLHYCDGVVSADIQAKRHLTSNCFSVFVDLVCRHFSRIWDSRYGKKAFLEDIHPALLPTVLDYYDAKGS
jgi:hypothetical protein